MGGDAPDQADWIKTMFEQRFPGIKATITVDLSKFHDVKVDEQLAREQIEPDVTHIQTTHNFERWKTQGALLHFKPEGFDQVWPDYTDPDAPFCPCLWAASYRRSTPKRSLRTRHPADCRRHRSRCCFGGNSTAGPQRCFARKQEGDVPA